MTTLSTTATSNTDNIDNNHSVDIDNIMTGNSDDKVDDEIAACSNNDINSNFIDNSTDNHNSSNNNDDINISDNNVSYATNSTTPLSEVLIIENDNDRHEEDSDSDDNSNVKDETMIEQEQEQQEHEPIQNSNNNMLNLHPIIERYEWDLLYDCLLMIQEYYTEEEIHETFVLNTNDNKSASSSVVHVACTYKVPYVLTLFIINIITSSIESSNEDDDTAIERYLLVGDDDGNTPLHLACGNAFVDETMGHADFSIIKTIASLVPQALVTVNKNGDTPFHMLLASTCFQQSSSIVNTNSIAIEMSNEEIVSSLLEILMIHMNHSNNTAASIDSIGMIPNHNGLTLLHIAVGNRCHERVLMKLVELAPPAARMQDQYGMIPLHYVARNVGLAPPTFVQQLMAAYPQCLYCQTYTTGDTPLHLFMKYARPYMTQKGIKFMDRSSIKLAELLLLGYNDGVNTTTTTMTTDENCNTKNDKDIMVVVSPILVPNLNNYTPIHYCALYDTPTQLLRIIVDKVPPAILKTALCITTTTTKEEDDDETTTSGGSTPLHILMASTKLHESYDNIRLLLLSSSSSSNSDNTNVCRMYDANGYIPLMVALQNKKCSSTVIKMMLKASPDIVEMKHSSTGMLPIHIAVRNRKIHKSVIKGK